jgi:hypothetical protein
MNNIDNFLDLLRKNKENMAARNFDEIFGVLMSISRKSLSLAKVRMGSYVLPFGLTRAVA